MANRADVQRIVFETLEFLLQDKPEASEPTLETKVKEVGIDSLDIVEVLMELEEEYEVNIPDDAVAECDTVDDLISLAMKIIEENG